MKLLLLALLSLNAAAAEVPLPQGTALTDPTGKISVSLVLPASGLSDCGLFSDRKGEPWLSCGRRLVGPAYGRLFSVRAPVTSAVWLDSGGLLAGSGEEAAKALMMAGRERRSAARLELTRLADFPGKTVSVAKGDNGAVYVLAAGAAGKPHEARLCAATAKDWRCALLLRSARPLAAAAGDGLVSFFASGRDALVVDSFGLRTVFTHPTEDLTGVAYSRRAGLYYATKSGVGFAGSFFHLSLLAADEPRLAMAGDSLLVLLSRTGEVLRLDGVAALGELDRAAQARWSKSR